MIKKIGLFFEEYIEKIVLSIVIIICAFLFIFFVLLSPNKVELGSSGEKVSPGEIDQIVLEEASDLTLNRSTTPTAVEPNKYQPRATDFLAKLNLTLDGVSNNLRFPNPESMLNEEILDPDVYNIADIDVGRITNINIEHIRAAAYIPTEPVTQDTPYQDCQKEPNDLDLVTVEAEYDISVLFKEFNEKFYDQVDEKWADPILAKPVLATVNLQRRELTNDGLWGDWQNVPRTKIDRYSKRFQVKERFEDLSAGGLQIHRIQLEDSIVQMQLLQPEPYRFASANNEWLPPRLHPDFISAINKELQQQKRLEREELLEERTQQREASRNDTTDNSSARRTNRTTRGNITNRNTLNNSLDSLSGTTQGRTRTGRRVRGDNIDDVSSTETTTTLESLTTEIFEEYDELVFTSNTDLSKMTEPLLLWAFDDTVEPGKSYQYRIRIGVLNPVASKNNPQVILWSDFSNLTRVVEIPERSYFFPIKVLEAAKTIDITVSRYALGYWYSESFRTNQGEAIGGVKENELAFPEDDDDNIRRTSTLQSANSEPIGPETINYDTGAVMVDIMNVNNWIRSSDNKLESKTYYEMLYSIDGTNIEHMPVNSVNWPENFRQIYFEINSLSRADKQPLRDWNTSLREGGQVSYSGSNIYGTSSYQ